MYNNYCISTENRKEDSQVSCLVYILWKSKFTCIHSLWSMSLVVYCPSQLLDIEFEFTLFIRGQLHVLPCISCYLNSTSWAASMAQLAEQLP